ncbi:MAG: amidohydrolase family protein [Bryobacterales bacterium]|nr:amidohydrolase family protein [Bryobacterales bacterium]
MRTYIAYTLTTLKLVMRDRVVLFFNYFLPLMFFVVFAQSFRADKGGAISQVITMVLILGVLGSGFFGAGLRAVQERELNILRRFKVAPITPLPILVASLITGLISYLPSLFLILAIAKFYYGMPWPERWVSLTLLLSVGLLSFRSMGLIIAAVVNTMQESQIIIQLLYLPMLFLSGATFPVSMLPGWLQTVAQFLPASYLYTGMQGILVQRESAWQNISSLAAMTATLLVATFLGVKLFRWEKEEVMPPKAKLWLLVVFLPFLALGTWQAYSKENVAKAKILYREMRRDRALLIRGPRIVVGDGRVIAAGGVLIRNGKIVKVFDTVPGENAEKAESVEAIGKTLLPGLNDAHVHLLAPGGAMEPAKEFKPEQAIARALAAYLYSGVTAVRSVGDAGSMVNDARRLIDTGDKQGAEVFHSAKMFTAAGGHGTEYFKKMPENVRKLAEQETLFLPRSAEEARAQVDQAKAAGARSVKIILESGSAGRLFNRLDTSIARAAAGEARKQGLAVAVHTGDARDMADAVGMGASSIEHGSIREEIPDAVFAEMAKRGVAYDPTLAVVEALTEWAHGRFSLLDRSLVQQTAPEGLIKATKAAAAAKAAASEVDRAMGIAEENLRRAYKAGVKLVTGSDAGNMLVTHGPAVHREMQLWVKAGIPASVALTAATRNTAELLGIGKRAGLIQPGYDATMILVDGNPLEEIAATERISGGGVFFKGERVDRAGLFEKD